MLEIGLIFRALLRNKIGAILIAAQIAVTMTIIVNAVHMINERNGQMARPSGLDEENSFYITSSGFAPDFNEKVTIQEDLNMLRNMPGIVNATQINAIPISGGGWSMGLQTEPGADKDGTGVAVYMVDEHGVEALDLNIIAGENFSATDIRWRERTASNWPSKVIISKAMAESLYPDESWEYALGQTVYINNDQPMTITGIMDTLQAPWVGWNGVERSMLSPEHILFGSTRYFIRTEPGMRDEMMTQVEEALAASNDGRIVRGLRSMAETRERSYRADNAVKTILTLVIVVLTIITSLGIVGLASFSVNRRKKQIGTRRALGATKGNVISYFMVENFLITSVGVGVGAICTVALNMYLVEAFSLPSLSWYYIPVGMLVLWVVGQLAVFGPAKRASNIAPAMATRSV